MLQDITINYLGLVGRGKNNVLYKTDMTNLLSKPFDRSGKKTIRNADIDSPARLRAAECVNKMVILFKNKADRTIKDLKLLLTHKARTRTQSNLILRSQARRKVMD